MRERRAIAAPADAVSAPPLSGRGYLRVERHGARSVVTRAYASSPLRLLTPGNHGHAAWIYTSTYGGGLVDGDDIQLEVHVGSGAAAFLSTQASTKVYRSPRGSRSSLRASVETGGLLVSWPDPVVPFADARYSQAQAVDIAAGGSLILVDALSSGRQASGERWAFADYRSRLEITLGGRLLVHDTVRLRAAEGGVSERMGRFDAWVLAVVAGDSLAREAMQIVQAASADEAVRGGDQLLSAAALGDSACIVRLAARTAEGAARTIREILSCVPRGLGEDPWTRKW